MREGIVLSASLHVVVVTVAVVGLPALLDPEPPVVVPVAVEVVAVEEEPEAPLAKDEPAAPEPPPEPPKAKAAPEPEPPPPAPQPPEPPQQVAAAPPPPPEPEPIPEPVPISKPEPPKELPPEAPPPKPEVKLTPPESPPEKKPEPPAPEPEQAEAAPAVPAPKRKPAPPPDAFATLLRNLEKQREKQVHEHAKQEQARATAPKLRRPDLPKRTQQSLVDRQRIAAALAQKIRTQVMPCWNPPIGAKDAYKIRVGVRIHLNPDGTLVGRPQIVEQSRLTQDPAFLAFAESAIRALQNPRCTPLRLPLEYYETWRVISFNFDPRELLQ